MPRFKLTWCVKGTNYREAAVLGLDETVEADSADEARKAAEYHAECAGVDLERYEVAVEAVED